MRYFGMSDRGLIRKTNQDSYIIAANEAGDVFAMLCDGIGGNLGGDVASHTAIAYFSKVFADNQGFADARQAKIWLSEHMKICNEHIWKLGRRNPQYQGMGTTFCGALMLKDCFLIVNIGDSRAYKESDDGQFQQMTVDHTLVADMLLHGEITQKEAMTSPRKNVLTNALGVWQNVRCDIETHTEPIRKILLCSDGLHGYVKESVIRKTVLDDVMDPSLKVRRLIKAALAAGGFDNVTVILIDMKGETLQ